MVMITISTKQLRTELPAIRAGLARGHRYTVIYRSLPIAELTPLSSSQRKRSALKGGRFNFAEKLGRELTPELINEIALTKYD